MREKITAQLRAAVHELYAIELAEIRIDRPEPQFGDYATNIALQLSKQLDKPPREIAEALVEKLRGFSEFSLVNVAGPGFINITLSSSAMGESIRAIVGSKHAHSSSLYEGKTVVAEYSDPNPFKVLHAGHLYTTLVGDSIARILEASGARVVRVNFGGDVGLHVARAMWGIIRNLGGEHPEKLQDIVPTERSEWISARYVDGTRAYEEDEAAKSDIVDMNKKVYQLHIDNDTSSAFAKIYWTCREWSYDGFRQLYDRLGVVAFDKYYPESSTSSIGLELVEQGLASGIFEMSDGAVVYRGEKDGLHTRVFRTGEGLPTYEAKDLGLIAVKWQDTKFDSSIMITGNDIIEYMKVVQHVATHFFPELTDRTKHLTHGMIRLPGGKKMSSRKGDVLLASDILDAAKEAYQKTTDRSQEEVVLGAIRYAFLRVRIGGDIIYDPDESVAIVGNPVLYSVRLCTSTIYTGENRLYNDQFLDTV